MMPLSPAVKANAQVHPSGPSTRSPVLAPEQKHINKRGQGCVSLSGEGKGQGGLTEPYITGIQSAKEENKEHKRKFFFFPINQHFKKSKKRRNLV